MRMKMGSMAIALIAEYGDCWPGAISLIGKICNTETPARVSHAASGAISPISPIPQLVVEAHENRGTRTPARRVMASQLCKQNAAQSPRRRRGIRLRAAAG